MSVENCSDYKIKSVLRKLECLRVTISWTSVRHDQGGIFGVQAQDAAKTMQPGMLPFQDISRPAGTDERKDIHFAAFHQCRRNLGAASVHEIDHPGGKLAAKARNKG